MNFETTRTTGTAPTTNATIRKATIVDEHNYDDASSVDERLGRDEDNKIPMAIGPHARVTWNELLLRPPQEPLKPDQPRVDRAARRPKVRVLHNNEDTGEVTIREEYVYLMQEAVGGRYPDHCYRRFPKSQKIPQKCKFGHVIFGIQLDRVVDNNSNNLSRKESDKRNTAASVWNKPHRHSPPPVYFMDPSRYNFVAIKKQHKEKVQENLRLGGKENPYTNILRMQQLGDDHHVLSCLDALEDEKYLYTVMPMCRTKSIMESLDDFREMNGSSVHEIWDSEAKARSLFLELLCDIHYLHEAGICHHDISPDNVLETQDGQLVLVDLAMSLTMKHDEEMKRFLFTPQGVFGKEPYLAPEVFFNSVPFDGLYLDAWAAGAILYNLLTGEMLFFRPHPTDILFKFFVQSHGLSPHEPLNERVIDVLMNTFMDRGMGMASVEDQQQLLRRAMAHTELTATALDLLHDTLTLGPADRLTLGQMMEHEWVIEGLE